MRVSISVGERDPIPYPSHRKSKSSQLMKISSFFPFLCGESVASNNIRVGCTENQINFPLPCNPLTAYR